jgi:hypothetical protein
MKTNRNDAHRTEILAEMSGIQSMHKGTASEQYNKVKRKDGRGVKNGLKVTIQTPAKILSFPRMRESRVWLR